MTDDSGVLVMTSSMEREEWQEANAPRGGAFTVVLTEGLTGKTDINKDGVVDRGELDAYVTDRLKELTRGQAAPGDGEADEHPVVPAGATVRVVPCPGERRRRAEHQQHYRTLLPIPRNCHGRPPGCQRTGIVYK